MDDIKIPWREPGPRRRAEEGRVVGVNKLEWGLTLEKGLRA